MHHVFLAPILSSSSRDGCPPLAFVEVPSLDDALLSDAIPPSQSQEQRVRRETPRSAADGRTRKVNSDDDGQEPPALPCGGLSAVLEGSEADISWSISRIEPDLQAPGPSNKREKRQRGERDVARRSSRQKLGPDASDDSIGVGPTPSVMRNHLESASPQQMDKVPSLPPISNFVKASELARRAIGPRRSSRLRLSEGMTSVAIDLPDSLVSLNTTTTLTPPSQASGPVLPTWTIPLSRLATLQAVLSGRSNTSGAGGRHSLIACVISTEPVIQRQRKGEKTRGQEGSLWISSWKIIAPPTSSGRGGTDEVSCGVKLWNEAAREWEGKVRRGDVVLLENVEYKAATAHDPASLSISMPSYRSSTTPRMTILYRTLPRRQPVGGIAADYVPPRLAILGQGPGLEAIIPEDRALRPDLSLQRSDMGIRRVKEVADWFARWVGGEPPPLA